jgi:hypothetical protein
MTPERDHESASTPGLPSLLRIELDCPWCLNATIHAPEADPQVRSVRAHSAEGCLEVDHMGSVESVMGTIKRVGRRIEVASNGEAVMAPAEVGVVTRCDHHPTPEVLRRSIGAD